MSLKEEDRRIIVEMEHDVSEEEILSRVEPARQLINKIKQYIANKWNGGLSIADKSPSLLLFFHPAGVPRGCSREQTNFFLF